MGNYKFDLDLPEGEAAERLVNDILCGDKGPIEVKRDFKVSETGNIAIEYRCRGKKSGISVSEALWWAFVLDGASYGHEVIILIKSTRLKEIARRLYKEGKHTTGGDDKLSEMVLVPLKELINGNGNISKPELI